MTKLPRPITVTFDDSIAGRLQRWSVTANLMPSDLVRLAVERMLDKAEAAGVLVLPLRPREVPVHAPVAEVPCPR